MILYALLALLLGLQAAILWRLRTRHPSAPMSPPVAAAPVQVPLAVLPVALSDVQLRSLCRLWPSPEETGPGPPLPGVHSWVMDDARDARVEQELERQRRMARMGGT